MSLCRQAFLLFTVLYGGLAMATPDKLPVVEQLEFEASYQGPLTGNNKLPIARVLLQTKEVDLQSFAGRLFETSMLVSSEPFAFVEESFPFRIRYRSLYQSNPITFLALEKYQLSDQTKHELTWVDRKLGVVGRYRQQGTGAGLPAPIDSWLDTTSPFRYYKPARHKILKGLLDRLAMLQSVRLKQMKPGAEYVFPVTDGKRLLSYRVAVVKLEEIQHGGTTKWAWKVVFNGLYTKKGVTAPRHAPIYLWLSKEKTGLPLRFVNYHQLGTFTVDLQGTDS